MSNHVALNCNYDPSILICITSDESNHRIPNLLGELLLRPDELFTVPVICCFKCFFKMPVRAEQYDLAYDHHHTEVSFGHVTTGML